MVPEPKAGGRSASTVFRAAARTTVALGLIVALAGLPSCGDGGGRSRALARSERFGILRDLEFYPRSIRLGGPFFLDRFESTRADWDRWRRATGAADRDDGDEVVDGGLPATGMSLVDARSFARWRFGRLPRCDEWLHAATGGGQYRRPWGDVGRVSWANTRELGFDALTPVGAFESGRQPGGPYDLIGNAGEWTETPDPRFLPLPVRIRELDVVPNEAEFGLRIRALARGAARWARVTVPAAPWPYAWVVSSDSARLPRVVASGWNRPVSAIDLGATHFWADSWWYERLRPAETSSVIGVRVATDPETLLARIAAVSGPLTAGEEAGLRAFLGRAEVRAVLREAAASRPGLARGPAAAAIVLREALGL